MKKKNRFLTKIFSLLMLVVMGFGAMSFTKANTVKVYAAVGDRYGNINWSISGSTLTISPVPGTDGAMADITSYDEAPWYYVDGKYSCDTIRSIIIEDGVTQIGTEAFCYFDKITRIDIPKSCKDVNNEAFYNCENLKEATIYGNVGCYAFAYCYSLEKVTIINNERGKIVGECAFYNCENLKEVTISAQTIDDDAFCYCYALEKLTLKEGCMNIANETFYKCQALTNLYLPSTLSSIDREAFYDCRNLKEVTYNGSKTDFNKITFDTDYNDVIVEALNNLNGRKFVYKSNKTYDYINEQGVKTTLDCSKENCFYMTPSTTELENAWYIVDSKIDFGGKTIKVKGNVKILLLDNCGIGNSSRLELDKEAYLYVYCESLDESKMGYIEANGKNECYPGIGNRYGRVTVTICGGNITANGGKYAAGVGCGYYSSNATVNIYGGTVTANGGDYAAGIGSGGSGSNATVNIYGGMVTANGGEDSAGIGSGGSGSNAMVNIYDGRVTANGGENAAGIGSGFYSNATVNIYDGTVNAKGGAYAAGIGSGSQSNAIVNIAGGNVEAHSYDSYGASIGSGFCGNATVTITGGYIPPCIIGAREGGTCTVNDYRDGKNKGTGTLLSNGSVIIVSVVGAIAFITCGVFVVLYIREKKKKGNIN